MGDEIVFDKMDDLFLELLDTLRDEVGFPIKLNSTYRSKEYNEIIQKRANKNYKPYSSRSKHLLGIAADLACTDSTKRAKIVYTALDLGLTVGVAKSFIHIDDRDNQIMFTY